MRHAKKPDSEIRPDARIEGNIEEFHPHPHPIRAPLPRPDRFSVEIHPMKFGHSPRTHAGQDCSSSRPPSTTWEEPVMNAALSEQR